ncbi:MAG: tungsten ABC transporter substrate-binding protein [Acidobacteria bacterium]|nr:tungsten ABC transporter substrate-binding protein [Acidobacteriota bacterium]
MQSTVLIWKKRYTTRMFILSAVLIGFLLFNTIAFSQEYRQIVVATGSPYELGLVDELAKAFRAEYGGVVRCVKTPTGPGLDLGRHGLAHITMGHEKEATEKFVQEGYAAKRVELMHNYTVVVGPGKDPAGIAGLNDLSEVHRKIFLAGSSYLSRGDRGGMHMLELKIWKELDLNPRGQSWYKESGTFMLDSLLNADKTGRYHMLDSSTWAIHKSKVKNLELFVTGPPNRYEMCLVNPDKHPHLNYNYDLAKLFYDFVAGPEGQRIIARFGRREYGESLYHPDVITNPQ